MKRSSLRPVSVNAENEGVQMNEKSAANKNPGRTRFGFMVALLLEPRKRLILVAAWHAQCKAERRSMA
jgi:hypothetical protein